MSELSVMEAVEWLLNQHAVAKTVSIWEEDKPEPELHECPAIRLKVPDNVNVQETRLAGGFGQGASLGGYKQVDWPLEIHIFSFDNGDGHKAFEQLVLRVKEVLSSDYRLSGRADIPPGFLLLHAERIDRKASHSETTASIPSVFRHATIWDWIREVRDV